MAEQKVNFGIKNVHYAVATEAQDGTFTYETPVPFPGAVTLALTFRGSQDPFYADDRSYYISNTNNGYDGTLTVAHLLQQFRIDVLGDTMDDNMVITENTNGKVKQVALLFEFDNDVKATRHVLYNVTLLRPGMTGNTRTDTTTPDTQELTFVAAPTAEGLVKRSTTVETPAAVYDAWYTNVFVPTPPSP